ncbi:MAG: hypothetical protein WB676_29325 [Bryobacteraceae bacterium]
MFSTIIKKASFAPALALLAGSVLAVPAAHAETPNGPVTIILVTSEYSSAQLEVTDLLKQVRASAAELSKDGDQLTGLMRSNVSRASYAASLDRIKSHINKTGDQLAQLEELKNEAAPWQQDAIDRITPLAREIATNTELAINHINEVPNNFYAQSYKDTLQAIADDAKQMKQNVSDFLDMAAAQQKADELQMKLASSNS